MKEAHFERLNLLIQVSELVKKFEKKSLFHIKKKKKKLHHKATTILYYCDIYSTV